MFSRIFGVSSSTTSRSATMRPTGLTGSPPALWLLDPTGCTPLTVNGGSQVTVGTSSVQGVITIDSDGTTCTGGNTTVSVSGSGSNLQAIGPPTGSTAAGQINLNALPNGSTICAIPAVIRARSTTRSWHRSHNMATRRRVRTSTGDTTAKPATRHTTASRSTTAPAPPPAAAAATPTSTTSSPPSAPAAHPAPHGPRSAPAAVNAARTPASPTPSATTGSPAHGATTASPSTAA